MPPRTIRFYISRGLVPGPKVAGRNASYGQEHLRRLQEIRDLQQRGLTLSAIGGALSAGGDGAETPQPTPWNSYRLQDDVVVMVRGDAAPWRVKQIQAAIKQFAKGLHGDEEGG